ncbi:major facilitator superfamily domain-containing protein, partial [Mycena filopes]
MWVQGPSRFPSLLLRNGPTSQSSFFQDSVFKMIDPAHAVKIPHATQPTHPPTPMTISRDTVEYRMYKHRFAGLAGLIVLNIVTGMTWPWFGPISNSMVEEFGISLDQVNWLGNVMACMYLPVSLCVPLVIFRYGIRRCCDIGAVALFLSAWIRYAGTARSLSPQGSYALLLLGQIFASIAQPTFQILAPRYSETWFDLNTRTTATMVIAIANPIGGAVGQLISPLAGTTRHSILLLAIISSAAVPAIFAISDSPPSPPTFAASQQSARLSDLLQDLCGRRRATGSSITRRERFDLLLLLLIFGILSAATNNFSILTAEILARALDGNPPAKQPVGYSANASGIFGAVLLLTGIISATMTAPLFDRVFTHHLALTTKIMVPVNSAGWLSLIWAVRPHNTPAIFAIMALLGISALTMLPVGLELASDLSRNPEGSAALMWFSSSLFSVVFIAVTNALRAGPEASPPLNMRRGLIFTGVTAMCAGALSLLIKGRQVRKELDEQELERVGRTIA